MNIVLALRPLVHAVALIQVQPSPQFTEVARTSGVEFEHFDPLTDRQYISETIGSGGGWVDFDGDGRLDLVLLNSAAMPGAERRPERPPANRFFRNRGSGPFENVSAVVWSCAPGFAQGGAAGDYDNDGFDDLYLTYYLGPNRLYHNNGDGTFDDGTELAGTGCPLWSTSCAWGDLDGDGALDLYVCNYLDMPIADYPYCGDKRRNIRTVCSPGRFPAQSDVVYRNAGDGTFRDATKDWGFLADDGRGLGVILVDLDDDGRADVYVANDLSANLVYRNLGGGRFQEQGLLSGAALGPDGQAQAGMGVDAADVNGDSRPDLFVTNFFRETNSLYRNDGRLQFQEIATPSGLGRPSYLRLGFGCLLFDADNDGSIDVFVANGHIDRNPERAGFPEPYAQPAEFFRGDGRGRFAEITDPRLGAYFQQRHVGRGAALADYDNDGDADIAVNHNGESAALLRNDSAGAGNWLRLRLRGTVDNRNAIGTRIVAQLGNQSVRLDVAGGRSYLSTHDLRPLLGLGKHQKVDQLTVHWPSGRTQVLNDLPSGRTIEVRE
jgi:hypothetical protein